MSSLFQRLTFYFLLLIQNGHTALHYGASFGELGTVTLLLGSGIDVDITNNVRTLTHHYRNT